MRKTTLLAAFAALSMAAGVTTARAADDTSLAHGLYFGNGNSASNFGFTTDTSNGVEIGLDYITRFVGPITPSPTTGNVYSGSGGTTVSGQTGSAVGLTFSIDTQPGGPSTPALTLGAIQATLSILDVGTGVTVSFNPVTAFVDNAEYGPTGVVASGSQGCSASAACGPTQYGLQNSQPLSLLGVERDPGFTDNSVDSYVARLVVDNLTTGAQSSVTAVLNQNGGLPIPAVPEPISISLFGVGLAGLVGVRRRRKSGDNDNDNNMAAAA